MNAISLGLLCILINTIYATSLSWNKEARDAISGIVMLELTETARIRVVQEIRKAGNERLHEAVRDLDKRSEYMLSWFSIQDLTDKPWEINNLKPNQVTGVIQAFKYLLMKKDPNYIHDNIITILEGSQNDDNGQTDTPVHQPSIPVSNVGEAIAFLVHTIGDVSNAITFGVEDAKKSFLYRSTTFSKESLWDYGLASIRNFYGGTLIWLNKVEMEAFEKRSNPTCTNLNDIENCVKTWAEDTIISNEEMIYVTSNKLTPAILVRNQIVKAGIRAAQLLNSIYDPNYRLLNMKEPEGDANTSAQITRESKSKLGGSFRKLLAALRCKGDSSMCINPSTIINFPGTPRISRKESRNNSQRRNVPSTDLATPESNDSRRTSDVDNCSHAVTDRDRKHSRKASNVSDRYLPGTPKSNDSRRTSNVANCSHAGTDRAFFMPIIKRNHSRHASNVSDRYLPGTPKLHRKDSGLSLNSSPGVDRPLLKPSKKEDSRKGNRWLSWR